MRRAHQLAWALAWALLGARTTAQEARPPGNAASVKACTGTVTDGCVVRYVKDTQEASEMRGRLVFQNYCVLCHGPEGRGDGRAAKLHTPRPFNLTTSTAPRYYIADMVRKGGEAMGRGKGMPPWGEQLTDEQVNDVLTYLFTLRTSL
ncbi:MAG: cytochrome c [Rhodoferax sp.]|nr:cytochrome c [Rhodoferax sp.]